MKKLLILLALLSLLSTPVLADSISNAFASKNQVHAGLYLKIPFTGGLKKRSKNYMSYGFKVGYTRDYRNGARFIEPRMQFKADLMKAEFKSFGFNKLNIGAQNILHYERDSLGFLTKKNGTISWSKVGLTIAGAALVTWGLIKVLDNDEDPPL